VNPSAVSFYSIAVIANVGLMNVHLLLPKLAQLSFGPKRGVSANI